MKDQGKLIGALLAGVGLMYLMDPDRGARRRSLVRDQATRAAHRLGEGLEATTRDLGNRARGATAALRTRVSHDVADDAVLHERVRSRVGRNVSHPGAIEVGVFEGRVTLAGDVLESERNPLLRAVGRVRGVTEVVDHLRVRSTGEGLPSLQGGRTGAEDREPAQQRWPPATRAVVAALGGALTFGGLRGGRLAPLLSSVGAGLLSRAALNLPVKRLTGIGAGPRVVDVQKVLNVRAPIDEVWALWSNFENFPRFMSHLVDVRRTGESASHWVAKGPAGARVSWDAVTTEWRPNDVVAWRSVPGSTVDTTGRVRFRSNPDATTQIDVRISYNPPGGAIGHAVATLFGADPKRAMDEDMVRLKSLLEEGRTRADRGPVALNEVTSGG